MNSKKNKIRNATPLMVNGIKFRSKLEVYCYEQLVKAKLKFKYEEEHFIIMEGFEYTNRAVEVVKKKGVKVYDEAYPSVRKISYTPDFTNLQQGWIIECKGFPNDSFPLRWKLFKKYIIDNDLKYDLYVPRNRKQIDKTIKLIVEKNGSI